MKKVILIVVVIVLGISTFAQRPPRLVQGDITLMRIAAETERLQNARTTTGQRYIDLHPLEWIAVNVYKQRSDGAWTTAVTGWRTDYGDSAYIYKETWPNVGPDLRLFSDTVNWGDAEIAPGPTGTFKVFSISKYWAGWKNLILERKPWPSQKMWRRDTTRIFTGGASVGKYKYKFFCDLDPKHVARVVFVDEYLGTHRPVALKDTFEYEFTINAQDPIDSLSRRPDRFSIIAFPPLSKVGSDVGPPANSFTVAPNPVTPGTVVTMKIKHEYEYGSVLLQRIEPVGNAVILKKKVTGQSVQVLIPPNTQPGFYALILSTPNQRVSKKIQIGIQ